MTLPTLEDQLSEIKCIDLLLVLGPADEGKVEHVVRLYTEKPLPVVFGRGGTISDKSEAEQMKASFLEQLHNKSPEIGGEAERYVHCSEGMDRLGDFFYSQNILEVIRGSQRTLSVGLVDDHTSIRLSMLVAKYMLPQVRNIGTTRNPCITDGYTVEPFPTSTRGGWRAGIREGILLDAYWLDCTRFSLWKAGREKWGNYFETKHPLHAPNPPWSFYKQAIKIISHL